MESFKPRKLALSHLSSPCSLSPSQVRLNAILTDLDELKRSLKSFDSMQYSPKLPLLSPTSARGFHKSEAYIIGKAKIKEKMLLNGRTKLNTEDEKYLLAFREKASRRYQPNKIFMTRDIMRKEQIRAELRRIRRKFGETRNPPKPVEDNLKLTRRIIRETSLKMVHATLQKRSLGGYKTDSSVVTSPFLSARESPDFERLFMTRLQ
mmetsp:Transcript_13037/g.24272  ORF Transcript_13037/g.24272 Transcript_13037/m.24272 type:complete len:207 (+) Transcript_13037:3724-4344(+)